MFLRSSDGVSGEAHYPFCIVVASWEAYYPFIFCIASLHTWIRLDLERSRCHDVLTGAREVSDIEADGGDQDVFSRF